MFHQGNSREGWLGVLLLEWSDLSLLKARTIGRIMQNSTNQITPNTKKNVVAFITEWFIIQR